MKLSSYFVFTATCLLANVGLALNYFDDFPVVENSKTVGKKRRE